MFLFLLINLVSMYAQKCQQCDALPRSEIFHKCANANVTQKQQERKKKHGN